MSKAIGMNIIKTRKYRNKKYLVNLYHAFVCPYITYCIESLGNESDIYFDALITRCTRGDASSFFCTYKTYLYA